MKIRKAAGSDLLAKRNYIGRREAGSWIRADCVEVVGAWAAY
jgi:hypothetical protein